ncbi:MAG: lyase [Nitrosopumilus sp.]|nr:lyase [Nitrosopumilus sp.]NND87263.1 lyase [Nitrosopumilus sp.]NNL53463.1 lyase [Nitrosopumilus sp.]NNM02816.1 lyase [Nitrosopumilus sp.]
MPGVKETPFIKEFEIPTPCTQPLSIITDSNGKVWFLQTNTGNITMFDPISEEFIEYENDLWNLKAVSMMWGIIYTEDNEIWFTDEINDFLWKFSISDKTYSKFPFPGDVKNAFPQKIGYYEGYFMINDFTGSRIVVVNHKDLDKDTITHSSISTPNGFFTSQTAVDNDGNVWFVMWKYQKDAILVKTNSMNQEFEQFSLPLKINAPNGVSIGPSGKIWIADTASSSFFSFNPEDRKVVEFITSEPPVWTFGNASGLIKTPISRPYWNAFDSDGNMWFNQQTANRLAVFNPTTESLIEYEIPSKNPGWSDCGEMTDCGTSQSFGFTILNDQVWFTEWAKNNIGVLDKTIPLFLTMTLDEKEIEIKQGQKKEIFVNIMPESNQELDVTLSGNTNSESIIVNTISDVTTITDELVRIPVTIIIDKDAHKGNYKILITTQFSDVAISTYATIKII